MDCHVVTTATPRGLLKWISILLHVSRNPHTCNAHTALLYNVHMEVVQREINWLPDDETAKAVQAVLTIKTVKNPSAMIGCHSTVTSHPGGEGSELRQLRVDGTDGRGAVNLSAATRCKSPGILALTREGGNCKYSSQFVRRLQVTAS